MISTENSDTRVVSVSHDSPRIDGAQQAPVGTLDELIPDEKACRLTPGPPVRSRNVRRRRCARPRRRERSWEGSLGTRPWCRSQRPTPTARCVGYPGKTSSPGQGQTTGQAGNHGARDRGHGLRRENERGRQPCKGGGKAQRSGGILKPVRSSRGCRLFLLCYYCLLCEV